jgi:TonB family protein
MTFFSDARETSSLFADYIEEVQQLLRAHHVAFGTPYDFLTFVQTLEDDSRLRNDLAVLLRSFMEGENKVSLPNVLSIVAIASGGPDLTISESDRSQPVNVLVDLLMSVGSSSPASLQNPDSHPNSSRSESLNDETPQTVLLPPSSPDHETHAEPFDEADDQSTLEAGTVGSDQDSLLHSGTENPLAESLTRLELNALQVKHYLDSIDQRISRIEPRLDNLPRYVPSSTTPHPVSGSGSEYRRAPDGRYSAMIATETLPHRSPHQSPDKSPNQVPDQSPDKSQDQSQDKPSRPDPPHPTLTTIPPEMLSLLESSSRQKRSRKKLEVPIITGAAIVLLLLLYWGFDLNRPSIAIHPVSPPPAQNTTIPPSNPASATGLPSQSHAAAAKALSGKAQNRPSHNSTPVRPSAASLSPSTSAALTPNPEESNDPSTLTTQPINVSAGVMAANVVSAPQPSYPKLASLTHMQGEVVMQAIISKDGTIENVHVIKGHRLLRGAATNAVRTWRYRPYLVNGQPVEVATTVSVDFKRPQ